MVVIDVAGDVTAGSEDALMRAFDQGSDDATDVVALDFGNLDYMNSGGIGLLVTLLVRANRQRQRLVAFGLNKHYRQIFELTRLDEAISLYDDEPGAVAGMPANR
jgi:anti-sigma B factor antagonist